MSNKDFDRKVDEMQDFDHIRRAMLEDTTPPKGFAAGVMNQVRKEGAISPIRLATPQQKPKRSRGALFGTLAAAAVIGLIIGGTYLFGGFSSDGEFGFALRGYDMVAEAPAPPSATDDVDDEFDRVLSMVASEPMEDYAEVTPDDSPNLTEPAGVAPDYFDGEPPISTARSTIAVPEDPTDLMRFIEDFALDTVSITDSHTDGQELSISPSSETAARLEMFFAVSGIQFDAMEFMPTRGRTLIIFDAYLRLDEAQRVEFAELIAEGG